MDTIMRSGLVTGVSFKPDKVCFCEAVAPERGREREREKVLSVEKLGMFGCIAFAWIPSQPRRKLDPGGRDVTFNRA